MRRRAFMTLVVVMAMVLSAFGVASAQTDDDDAEEAQDGQYSVTLAPANDSGVSGSVQITIGDNMMTVDAQFTGLEPGLHPFHIHGFPDLEGTDFGDRESRCATPADDLNDDGIISVDESELAGGPPVFPLDPYVMADDDGTATFHEMYILSDVERAMLGDLTDRVVEIHGMTTSFDQDMDGVTDEYEPMLPVACGEIAVDDDGDGNGDGDGDGDDNGFVSGDFSARITGLDGWNVDGGARINVAGGMLGAVVTVGGLQPHMVYSVTIHGSGDGLPTTCEDLDLDGDGDLSDDEAIEAYGRGIVGLGTVTASGHGGITLMDIISLQPGQMRALGLLSNDVIVIWAGAHDGGSPVPVGCGVITMDDTDDSDDGDDPGTEDPES